jgi:hypothetical protein
VGGGVSEVQFRSGSWVVTIRGVAHAFRFIIFFVASIGAVGISVWGGLVCMYHREEGWGLQRCMLFTCR